MRITEQSIGGIYEIVNMENGHEYVGQTGNFKDRQIGHWSSLRGNYHSNQHLQSAWNKYGEDAFVFDILEIVQIPKRLSQAELCQFLTPFEQIWMDKLDPRYNMAPAAGTTRGYKHSEETRAKLSEIHKGRKQDPEVVAKRTEKIRGQKRTDEQRQRMSDASRGKPKSPEHVAAMAAGHVGLKMPEGHGEKISAALTGRSPSPETRAKISTSLTGRKQSDETRAKNSASKIGKPALPSTLDAMAEGRRLKNAERQSNGEPLQSEETRARRSASLLAFNARKRLEVEQQSPGGNEWQFRS